MVEKGLILNKNPEKYQKYIDFMVNFLLLSHFKRKEGKQNPLPPDSFNKYRINERPRNCIVSIRQATNENKR